MPSDRYKHARVPHKPGSQPTNQATSQVAASQPAYDKCKHVPTPTLEIETLAWELQLGNFSLGTLAWELWLGNFSLGTSAGKL